VDWRPQTPCGSAGQALLYLRRSRRSRTPHPVPDICPGGGGGGAWAWVLLAAAALSALIGHPIDALVILAVVVVNAIIGFIQEGRAEEALAAIRR
jgi:hypothetical protein